MNSHSASLGIGVMVLIDWFFIHASGPKAMAAHEVMVLLDRYIFH